MATLKLKIDKALGAISTPPKELEVARDPRKWDKSNHDKYFRKTRHFRSSFEMCGGAAAEAPNQRMRAR